MLGTLYNEILYRPLVNILVFFYQALPYHDLGLAIILLTIFVRLILYPITAKSLRAQKDLAGLQPEIKALQEKHKDNREEQTKRIMELYRERGVNPFSGCLPVLIQLPLLFALYQVFLHSTGAEFIGALYGFVSRPESLSPIAFGIVDLSKPNAALAVLAGVSQFVQGYRMPSFSPAAQGESAFQKAMQTQMVYMLPIIITVISFKFPAALAIYWVVLNLIGILQQELTRQRTAGSLKTV